MMLDLHVTVREFPELYRKMKPAGFRAVLRKVIKKVAILWHRNFAKHHFARVAYSRYPKLHKKNKKSAPGRPLVKKGTARGRILARRSIHDVIAKRGNRVQVRLRLKYGRPGKYSERWLKRRVVRQLVKTYGYEYRVARAMVESQWHGSKGVLLRQLINAVYRQAGYSKRAKGLFDKSMATASKPEIKEMARWMKALLVKALARRGRPRKRKIV